MILSRELGKRIWGGSTNTENGGGGVSSDYIAGLLAGYATESWVDEHYISIDFFSRLFQAHGTENGSEIDVLPNDMETTITSVESMFGFWTNLYISALGSNGAAPAGISLGMLTDVNISGTPSAGQVLTFDAVTQKWINGNAQAGASSLATLTDVTLTSLQANQVLVYNGSAWVNSSLKTIGGYSIFGSGDIPVSGGGGGTGNYLPIAGGTLTGTLTINTPSAYPLTLKGSYNYTVLHYLNDSGTHLADIGTQTNSEGTCFYFSLNSNSPYVHIVSIWNTGLYYSSDVTNFKQHLILSDAITRNIWGHSFNMMNDINGCIYINADTPGYREGIRIKPYGGWTTILLGGSDLSSDEGTSPNSWSIHNNNGAFYVARNGSALNASASFGNTDGYTWQFNGNVYATGGVTALSDIRHKTVIRDAAVSVEDIARMPAVMYQWNDGRDDKELHVGSIAQSWQTVLPEVVLKANDEEGTLSMQYGVAALVSAIVTARKVVDHERRIHELEKENERLKKEVEQLRLN